MRQTQRYGKIVWENEEFEEQRKGNCMCYHCDNMKVGQDNHCEIAKRFYEICKEYGCAFIMTRCEKWKQTNTVYDKEIKS